MSETPNEPFFRCKIPGRPRIQKNRQRIMLNRSTGKRFIGKSDEFQNWAAFAKLFIDRAKTSPMFTGPVSLKVTVYLKNHQHEPDLSNVYQGIEDLMQACQVIKNDRQINSHDGSRKVFDPECKERVEIELRELV